MKKLLFFMALLCVVGMHQSKAADDAVKTSCWGNCFSKDKPKSPVVRQQQPAGSGALASATARPIDDNEVQVMDLTPRRSQPGIPRSFAVFEQQNSSSLFEPSGDLQNNPLSLPGSLNEDPVRASAGVNSPARQPSPRVGASTAPHTPSSRNIRSQSAQRTPSPRMSVAEAQRIAETSNRASIEQLQQVVGQNPVAIYVTTIINVGEGTVKHTNLTPPDERRAQMASPRSDAPMPGSGLGSPNSATRSRRLGAAPPAPLLSPIRPTEGKRQQFLSSSTAVPSMSPLHLSSVHLDDFLRILKLPSFALDQGTILWYNFWPVFVPSTHRFYEKFRFKLL